MGRFNATKTELIHEISADTTVPSYSSHRLREMLGSAVRDMQEAIHLLDSRQQSEAAGRLHALSVELREIAADSL